MMPKRISIISSQSSTSSQNQADEEPESQNESSRTLSSRKIMTDVSTISIGTKDYANGSYMGEFNIKGQREGYGMLRYTDGSVYKGAWKEDLPEGVGSLRCIKGTIYVGEFHGGQKHGKGKWRVSRNARRVKKGYWQYGIWKGSSKAIKLTFLKTDTSSNIAPASATVSS